MYSGIDDLRRFHASRQLRMFGHGKASGRKCVMRVVRGILVITVWVSILSLCSLTPGHAASSSEASKLIVRLSEKAAAIKDLEGLLVSDFKKGPGVAPLKMEVRFKSPFSFHFDVTAPPVFKFERLIYLVNKEGFISYCHPSDGEMVRGPLRSSAWHNFWMPLTISLSPETTISGIGEPQLVGTEAVDGVEAYVLAISPFIDSNLVYTNYSSAKVWIDCNSLAVVKSRWNFRNDIYVESTTSAFKTMDDGLQLPIAFRTVKAGIAVNYSLSDIKVNQDLPAEQFMIKMPKGAVFSDIEPLRPEEYLRKLESDPKDVSLYYNLGKAYLWEEGNFQKAIATFKKLLELNPDCKPARSALEQAQKKQTQWRIDNPAIPERKTNRADKNTGDINGLINQLKNNDRNVQKKAAEALGKIRDKKAVDPLIVALKDEDWQVREEAVLALGRIGDKRAVEPLIAGLEDEDGNVRERTAYALGNIGDKRAAEPLVTAIKKEDGNLRLTMTIALAMIGDERAVEPLVAALGDKSHSIRCRAALGLGWTKDKAAVEPLITTLKNDGNGGVRGQAAVALGRIKDKRALEPLIAALKDNDKQVQSRAASGLGWMRDWTAVKPLIVVLENENERVRRKAAEALKKITGQGFGEDSEKWQEWWEENKKHFFKGR